MSDTYLFQLPPEESLWPLPSPRDLRPRKDILVISSDADIRVVNGRLLPFPLHCFICFEFFGEDIEAYEAHCRQHIENGDVG